MCEPFLYNFVMDVLPLYLQLLLTWPVFAFVFVLMFQAEIRVLISRVRRGKFFGNEIELNEAIDKFEAKVKDVEKIPQELSTAAEQDDAINILKDSATDPKIGILILAREIEKEIRHMLASLGLLQYVKSGTVAEAFELLTMRSSLPRQTLGALAIFWQLRNQVVHGKALSDDSNVIRVLDIGVTLLTAIRSIPHEIYKVHQSGIDLFEDEGCTMRRDGVKGLILETTSPGGIEKSYRIFPVTNWEYYKKGMRVSWEWDLSEKWGKTWYVNPQTQEKNLAWGSAGKFAGRDLSKI